MGELFLAIAKTSLGDRQKQPWRSMSRKGKMRVDVQHSALTVFVLGMIGKGLQVLKVFRLRPLLRVLLAEEVPSGVIAGSPKS